MYPKISHDSQFRQIADSITHESYTQKTKKKIDGRNWPIVFESVITNPDRKQHAVLLKDILTQTRSCAKERKFTPRQADAIEQLVRHKKDELAIRKFLENPKRTFKTQGTEYELIRTSDGRYSCVDKKQYQKCANGMWMSKREPHITFYGAPVADPKQVGTDQIAPIDEIRHRPLEATYMNDMFDVKRHPQWCVSSSNEMAEAELSRMRGGNGTFIIHSDKREDCYAITYKIGNEIAHESFDKDTGIMEKGTDTYPPRTIQTVIRNLESMQGQHASPARVTRRDAHNASATPSRGGPRNATTQAEARENIERYNLEYFPNGLAMSFEENGEHYVLVRARNNQGREQRYKLPYIPQTRQVHIQGARHPIDVEQFLSSKGIKFNGNTTFLN
jgi:hypothetical protein